MSNPHRKKRRDAFLLYIDDWLASTAIDLMSPSVEAGYLRLLLHSWKSEDCGVPDDDRILARLTRLGKTFRGSVSQTLRAQFVAKNGRLYNERLLEEREYQQSVNKARSEAATTANEARWGIRDGSVSDPPDIQTETETVNLNINTGETGTTGESSIVERIRPITANDVLHVQEALGAHRGNGSKPDARISRSIAAAFPSTRAFDDWVAGLNVNPFSIRGKGWGIYRTNAFRWLSSRSADSLGLPADLADLDSRFKLPE